MDEMQCSRKKLADWHLYIYIAISSIDRPQATDQLYAWKSKKRNLKNKEAMRNLHLHSEAT